MIEALPPGLILVLGALLTPLLPGRIKGVWTAILPLLGLAQLLALEPGTSHTLQLFDYQLTVVRVDKLSLVFGYIFHIAAFSGEKNPKIPTQRNGWLDKCFKAAASVQGDIGSTIFQDSGASGDIRHNKRRP